MTSFEGNLHQLRYRQDVDDDTDDVNVKASIEEILKESGFSDVRPAKMSVDDLLK